MVTVTALLIGAAVVTAPLPPRRPAPQASVETEAPPSARAPLAAPVPPRKPPGRAATQPPAQSSPAASAQSAPSTSPAPKPEASSINYVCKDPRLVGRRLPPILGAGACGISDPVKITRIAGIALSSPATLNCRTARVFADWLISTANPAARTLLNRRLKTAHIYGSYTCRTHNHRPGARLSEHSFGRAVDVGGFTLGDGQRVSVLKDWGKGTRGTFLKRIWAQACGPFKTVLGPNADQAHKNHFHFDTALRRNAYCR